MDVLKSLAAELDGVKDNEKLIEKLKDINKNYTNDIAYRIISRDVVGVSEDMYVYEKLMRNLIRKYPADNTERKLYSVIGETVSISKVASAFYNYSVSKEQFERKVRRILQRRHVEQVVSYVYRKPDIRHGELSRELGITASVLTQLMSVLIENGIVCKFVEGKYSFYELSPLMVEYYDRNMNKKVFKRSIKYGDWKREDECIIDSREYSKSFSVRNFTSNILYSKEKIDYEGINKNSQRFGRKEKRLEFAKL